MKGAFAWVSALKFKSSRAIRIVRTRAGEVARPLRFFNEWVLFKVVSGKLNKQIAGNLGTVERTIKAHRAPVVGKCMSRHWLNSCGLPSIWGDSSEQSIVSPLIADR